MFFLKTFQNYLELSSYSYVNFCTHIKNTNEYFELGKPRIIKHLEDTVVDEGATLHLEVEVEACPEPTVKWLRNGREVNADARIKITRDTHRHETYNLDVDLIKYEEQGEYEVVVTNALGTVSSKSYVTVQSKYILVGRFKIVVKYFIKYILR